jgi:hypothetical protein
MIHLNRNDQIKFLQTLRSTPTEINKYALKIDFDEDLVEEFILQAERDHQEKTHYKKMLFGC